MPSPSAPISAPTYPAIPDPGTDLASLRAAFMQAKEILELLTGQRGTNAPTEFSIQGSLRQIEQQGSRVYELTQVSAGLASRMDLVETGVGDVSASGQVVIRAEANPTGYKAYFGVYLKATADSVPGTERKAGMSIALDNADGAVTAFDTDKFIIRDAVGGTMAEVFSYSGGFFTLTGSVTVNGSLIVNGTVVTGKVATNAITSSAGTSGGSSLSVDITVRAGARILIIATSAAPTGQFSSGQATGSMQLRVEGSLITSIRNTKVRIVLSQSSGGDVEFGEQFANGTILDVYTAGGAGTYTVNVTNNAGVGGWDHNLAVVELAR